MCVMLFKLLGNDNFFMNGELYHTHN